MIKNQPGFTRSLPTLKRAENSPATISGLGAVYYREGDAGSDYWLWDDVVERIRPGAFDTQLAADVRSFFNHNPDRILGRTTANTLALSVNADGLLYSVTPPETEDARAVLAAVERGDVTGSSFMFIPTRTVWEEIKREGEPRLYIRWIEEVELWEVGPVAFPAYSSTTAEAQRDASGTHSASRYQHWLTRHVEQARSDWAAEFETRVTRTKQRERLARTVAVELHQRESRSDSPT